MSAGAGLGLASEVAEAHAAAALAAADCLTVSFSSGGLAFTVKGQRDALLGVEARLTPARQEIVLTGARPRAWTVAIADGADLGRRLRRLRAGRRRWHWQPEDVGAFAAGALWTYLTLPLLLGRAETVHRLRDAGALRRLRITLPPAIAGHGRVQTLGIGPDSLIRRHDYTATAFGSWARAAQEIGHYQAFDGVPLGTVRTVTPRWGRALPGPTLVWIRIHSAHLVVPARAAPSR